MNNIILKMISFIGLGLTIIPSILVFTGVISFDAHITLMIIGMLCWFLTAPFWINKVAAEKEQI
jgi:hypothetical protein